MPLSTDDYRADRVTYAAPPLPQPPPTRYVDGELPPRRKAIGGCLLLLFVAACLFAAGMLCILGTAGTLAVAYRPIGWIAGLP